MDSVILHEIAISLLSLSLPTHAYRLEISPRWQWPDLASIRPPHISIVALRLNYKFAVSKRPLSMGVGPNKRPRAEQV